MGDPNSIRHFEQAYKPAVDAWAKYDNEGESPSFSNGEKTREPEAHHRNQRPRSARLLRRDAPRGRVGPRDPIRIDTDLIVVKNGQLFRIPAQVLRAEASKKSA
jgi:hypothetical protein